MNITDIKSTKEKLLKQRQQIISLLIRKWTDNEIEEFLNVNSNLTIHTEGEVKNHILDNNMYLFNKDELYTLNKIKTK